MIILLASHNFYPYYQGGTEVYVLNLAKHLNCIGHQVHVISAIDEIHFTNQEISFQDHNIKVCNYIYEDISVYGVLTYNISTKHIYSKHSKANAESYSNFFSDKHFDILHIHCLTPTIGLDLIYAIKKVCPAIRIITSYHTAISDPKETLTFANTLAEIHYPVDPIADILSYRLKLPYYFTRILVKFFPNIYLKSFPAVFNIKYLIKLQLESFEKLKLLTDEWWVYSQGIRRHLIDIGVDGLKIKFERHGVSQEFIGNINKAVKPIKFLFSGRMLKIKGFHTLINAWMSLPENKEKELWITGKPESKDMFTSIFIKKTVNRKDVKWLGQLSQKELAEIYVQVNCVIIPSEWYEIGPLVFHEAIASGCNVIASDIGGCKELAEVYGFRSTLFKAGDSTSLCTKIMEQLEFNVKKNKAIEVLSFEEHFNSIMKDSLMQINNN